MTQRLDPLPSLNEVAEEAQRALKERPSVSIRTRLTAGFLAWFALSLAIAVFSMVNVSSISEKLHFLESAQNYTFEIQQARRFEKNFFLYRTNLDDALEHVHQARKILVENRDDIIVVMGESNLETMQSRLGKYEDLLLKLDEGGQISEPDLAEIESQLRTYGSEMVTVANDFMDKERQQINSMLALSHKVPVIFLIILLLLFLFLAYFIASQMLAPLNRMMAATQRIAEGDFTPITARRRYNDEFSKLAMALNHMMQQLLQRHEQLVQAHKLKAVGTLTAGIAHELNNPLNNIILTSSALMDDHRDISEDELVDMINDLLNESERARKIVRKLLDFARESELEPETLHIKEVVDHTLQLSNNQIKIAKVKIIREFGGNDLPQVYGDKQQLTQVFLNIILNSLDAMPKGGELTITARNTDDRENLAVDFTDTGIGIPEHKLAEIFDPFYTSKKGGKGTGLGLSVSLGIVQKHGGTIKVKSKVNKGTTFTVLLPAAKIPAEAVQISS